MKREEVDRRVKEDTESYSAKFSDEAKSCCQQVSLVLFSSLKASLCWWRSFLIKETLLKASCLKFTCSTVISQTLTLFFSHVFAAVTKRCQDEARVRTFRRERYQNSQPLLQYQLETIRRRADGSSVCTRCKAQMLYPLNVATPSTGQKQSVITHGSLSTWGPICAFDLLSIRKKFFARGVS